MRCVSLIRMFQIQGQLALFQNFYVDRERRFKSFLSTLMLSGWSYTGSIGNFRIREPKHTAYRSWCSETQTELNFTKHRNIPQLQRQVK